MHHTVQSCAPHHGVSYAPLFTHYTSSCKQLCGSNCELYNVPSLAPHSALSFAPHCWSCCAIHCAQSCAPNWVPNYAPHCEQSHASHSAPRDRVAVCHNLQPYGVPGRAPNLSTSHIDNNFMGILWPLISDGRTGTLKMLKSHISESRHLDNLLCKDFEISYSACLHN